MKLIISKLKCIAREIFWFFDNVVESMINSMVDSTEDNEGEDEWPVIT